MWTPAALASEARPWQGPAWRIVEGQARVSTMKIVDTLLEQKLLEGVLDRSKPAYPPSCDGLHYLLATPFRYWPYPTASRFRRANQLAGCFYAATTPETAIAEIAFYRWLFFAEAPGMRLPANALEHTAFTVQVSAALALDLRAPPLDRDEAKWTQLTDYTDCHDLADSARQAEFAVILYRSVRDPQRGTNLAVLTPAAFGSAPENPQSWSLFVASRAVQAFREMPPTSIEFTLDDWAADPRVAAYRA
jgi:RES domain